MFLMPTARAKLLGMHVSSAATRQEIETALDGLVEEGTHNLAAGLATVPSLKNDAVVNNVMRAMITRKLDAFQSAVRQAPPYAVEALLGGTMASALSKSTGRDMSTLHLELEASIVRVKERNRPARLTAEDFKAFHRTMLSTKGGGLYDRTVTYETFYFTDRFVDRFGTKLEKPTLSLNVTNKDINGAIAALLESIADAVFPGTPVWTDAKPSGQLRRTAGRALLAEKAKYYPGGTSNLPSVLIANQMFEAQSDKPDETAAAKLAQPLVGPEDGDFGCGMTELKAEALMYLSGKAATWAAGQSGFVMGLLGGTNLGFPIALAKFSIGDNQTLQTVVQTTLAFTARRGTYEALWPLLSNIDQKDHKTLAALVQALLTNAGD
jgi:hypothetical protein